MLMLTDDELAVLGRELEEFQSAVDRGTQCVGLYPRHLRLLVRLFDEYKAQRGQDDGLRLMFAERIHPAQLEERARTWQEAFELLIGAK